MPLETQSDEESIRLSKESGKNVYYCKTEFSAKKIAELTQRLVQMVKSSQRVFFVNFIKFIRPNQAEIDILRLVQIEPYLDKFQKDYYEWGGYLYPTVIIKHSEIRTSHKPVDVFSLLGSDTIYNYQEKSPTTVLERMIHDISKKGRLKNVVNAEAARISVLQSVIDITGNSPEFIAQVVALLHTSTSGGKRRRRKTRRKVWRGGH
jgi:hypothetical protein